MIVSKPLFIHQYPDWTKFRYNAQSVIDALGQTRLQEGALVGVADLVCKSDFETKMLARDIAANYALDGIELDLQKLEDEIQKKNSAKNHNNLNRCCRI